jgi:sugar fermentation stimulation protein
LAHLNNTGRLHDLLKPNVKVVCMNIKGSKLNLRIIGTVVDEHFSTLIDTKMQENAFIESIRRGYIPWIRVGKIKSISRDFKINDSKIDLYIENQDGSKILIELKSAVYFFKNDFSARYPDTISLRGRRHIIELASLKKYRRIIVFIVAHPYARVFKPSTVDPELPKILKNAVEVGVEVRSVKIALNHHNRSIMLIDPDLSVELDP